MSERETPVSSETEKQTCCYAHPERPTRLICTRCDRPICGACATPAHVGQHCPECVGEARRTAPRVRSAMTANSPAVVVIVVVNIAFFLLQRLAPAVTEELFLLRPAVSEGQWYRLLTSIVLHGGLLHLALNQYVLWVYGPLVEQALGTPRFVLAYLAAGLAASATSYALGPCLPPSLGASGAIFGVVGILLLYLYRRRTSTFAGQFLTGVLVFVGVNLVFGFIYPGIDNLAHIGGLLGGLLLGLGLDVRGGRVMSMVANTLTFGASVAISVVLVVGRTIADPCGAAFLG